ncbi:hypothetical protein ES705_32281 [subsurface metagenome]
MKMTGVFATEEEAEKLQEMAKRASETPMITFQAGVAPPSPWKPVKEAVHKCALEHGLPEIQGFYGLTPEGEFVSV